MQIRLLEPADIPAAADLLRRAAETYFLHESAPEDAAGFLAQHDAAGLRRNLDAGFVYHTDALSTRGRTIEIRVPKWAQPAVRYQICAVKRPGANTSEAEAYIKKVTGGQGRTVLKKFGFGLPPRG